MKYLITIFLSLLLSNTGSCQNVIKLEIVRRHHAVWIPSLFFSTEKDYKEPDLYHLVSVSPPTFFFLDSFIREKAKTDSRRKERILVIEMIQGRPDTVYALKKRATITFLKKMKARIKNNPDLNTGDSLNSIHALEQFIVSIKKNKKRGYDN